MFARHQFLKTVLTNSYKGRQLLQKVFPNISEHSEKCFVLTDKQLLRKTINSIIGLFSVFLMKFVTKVAARLS